MVTDTGVNAAVTGWSDGSGGAKAVMLFRRSSTDMLFKMMHAVITLLRSSKCHNLPGDTNIWNLPCRLPNARSTALRHASCFLANNFTKEEE
jgi:hypothetical protein